MKFDLLRAERLQHGWSQAKLAEELGVDMRTVRRWERGQAIPFPYYRRQLSILFGKTAKELGLPSESDEDDATADEVVHNGLYQPTFRSESDEDDAMEDTALAGNQQPVEILETNLLEDYQPEYDNSPQQADQYICSQAGNQQPVDDPLLAGHFQVHQQATHTSGNHLFAFHSLWDVHIHMRCGTSSRPSNRLLWPFLLIISAMLVMILIMVTVLPAFHQQPPSKSTPAEESYGPPSYTLTIPTIDPSLQNTAQHLQQTFNAVYPQLVNRFALDPATAPRNVTLTFSFALSSPATTSNTTITLRPDWIQHHPNDVGLLTNELTVLLEQYPSGAPAWFSDGIAAYARDVYGPADDDWSLPDTVQPQDSYTQGGATAARFLLWLEQYTRLDIVDQLNHALQTKQPFSSTFQRLTHHTVDELWSQYKGYPAIALLPDQLYKTATSRKPVYQSSFQLRPSDSNDYAYIQGLSPSNFAMQADITILSGKAGAGLFFRDESNNDYWETYVYPSGYCQLFYQNHTAITIFSPAIKTGYNQTNRLAIIAQKHTIYMYINSQFITQTDDEGLSSGQIGVITSDNSLPTDVQFQNVQIF